MRVPLGGHHGNFTLPEERLDKEVCDASRLSRLAGAT
jgi:hypothetical protein